VPFRSSFVPARSYVASDIDWRISTVPYRVARRVGWKVFAHTARLREPELPLERLLLQHARVARPERIAAPHALGVDEDPLCGGRIGVTSATKGQR
jgi:hypothetical protein